MTTKVKPVYDPNGQITDHQKKSILKLCNYDMAFKDKLILQATNGATSSINKLTQAQATKIMRKFDGHKQAQPQESSHEANWGNFDPKNPQHVKILSVLRTANITIKHHRWGEVADMKGWFCHFLHSKRSPVQKPLNKMTKEEVTKIIVALEGVAVWKMSI
ncbi:hypothetical protein ACUXZJ_10770 [Flavobacterium sp. TN-1]